MSYFGNNVAPKLICFNVAPPVLLVPANLATNFGPSTFQPDHALHCTNGGTECSVTAVLKARRLHLRWNVVSLILKHGFLELSGKTLLEWYLNLPFEDRKIIQDSNWMYANQSILQEMDQDPSKACHKKVDVDVGAKHTGFDLPKETSSHLSSSADTRKNIEMAIERTVKTDDNMELENQALISQGLEETKSDDVSAVPPDIASALEKLKLNYLQMRKRLMNGTALDDTPPLSLDVVNIGSVETCIPSQILTGQLSCTNEKSISDEECCSLPTQKDTKRETTGIHVEHSRSLTLQLMQKDELCPSAAEDLNKENCSSEVWFDALEHLEGLDDPAHVETVNVKDCEVDTCVGGHGLQDFICVEGVPVTMSKKDLMVVFEKYKASEVLMAKASCNSRLAFIRFSDTSLAEIAVTEMDGKRLHGRTINVSIVRTLGYRKHSALWSESGAEYGMRDKRSSSSKYTHSPGAAVGASMAAKRQRQKLSDVSRSLDVLYTGYESYTKIMNKLIELHPDIELQKITETLASLRKELKGSLYGLYLSNIVETVSAKLYKSLA
ncbi:RNA-binding protein 44 isoform X2 [Polypterus senegalus]|uniref:RNA-binding protein 44 isoform X2 n=1 Tax=Polypterus senegalus TaxID=55291 RepID=UPI0019641D17|nr:RNA-binding protein 44 isoform X2 [Polypterus senegalus]